MSVAVGASALLATTAPVVAAPKPITGRLSAPGFTVIGLDETGEAVSARTSPKGRFKLTPPAKHVTLHLRAPDGTYAGPIVVERVGRKGKKTILGLDAGAELGKVKVRDGYAKVKGELPREEVDRRRWARAKKGVPIGAGLFGRVVSAATGTGGPGQDLDRDGIPGALDIDDDGDLILDDLDLSTGPPAPRGLLGPPPGELFDVLTSLALPLESTANANAPGSTDSQIEAALPSFGHLLIEVLPGDSPELDCGGVPNPSPPPPLVGGLAYCSTGGTGTVSQTGGSSLRFPDAFDSDGDGLGALEGAAPPGGGVPFMFLSHGARTDQIGTGDILIERVTRGGVESQFPATLQFVFATVPALVSYADTAGNSATVSYPVASAGPGTQGNGFPVGTGPDGDVVVTLTLWRPQRRPIPPETGSWIDVGGLTYSTIVGHLGPVGTPPGGTSVNQPCPRSTHSTTDPELGPPLTGGAFTDLATDRPASPANTLTYTVNLTDCLASLGSSWTSGDEVNISFATIVPRPGAGAGAGQTVWFKLP